MPRDTLLLVGRETDCEHSVYETHAEQLRRRRVADTVGSLTYEHEPRRELRDELRAFDGDRTFVVPMCLAHSRRTIDGVPAALDHVDGEVHYCEPVGRSPAITQAIVDRASASDGGEETTGLALVGFGSSGSPFHRQAAEYHAARIRDEYDYADVAVSFLLQNPTVECVRYNVDADRIVAVPLFFAPSSATESEIPAKLELSRGGVEYTEPLGAHEHVTDAIEAEVEKQRVLAADAASGPHSFESALTHQGQALATDGEGVPR